MQLSFAFFLSLVALVAAASDSASCGKTQYTTNAINKAADASCSYIKKGTTVGTNNYPHEYKNLEKFSLQGLSGPFFEFPVLANGQIYSGGASSRSQPGTLLLLASLCLVGSKWTQF